MVASAITIQGGTGTGAINYAFTAQGTNTVLWTTQFAGTVDALLTTQGVTTVSPSAPTSSAFLTDGTTPIYDLVPSTVSSTFTLPDTVPAYVIDTVGGASTVTITGDSVIVAAVNAAADIIATGDAHNEVIFVSGYNTFDGTGNTGNDFVVAGSGYDTITTGTGDDTVLGGTGSAVITLNDTAAGGYNDFVYLNDGSSLVYADGTGDVVVATSGGQTIDGAASAASTSVLTVTLLPDTDTITTGDVVNLGGAYANIFDSAGGDTINSGGYAFSFFGGTDIADTINVGDGSSTIFGGAGDTITLGASATTVDGFNTFISSSGSETLDASATTVNLTIFGTTDAAGGNDSLIGGSGADTFVAGAGSETLVGGSGANTFYIDAYASHNADLTIQDFGGADSIAFASSYSAADVASAIANGVEDANGDFVITFDTSNTTITLVGVSGASALTGHTITFGS
jgi:Ca2+-binding RTX toxin-like protein